MDVTMTELSAHADDPHLVHRSGWLRADLAIEAARTVAMEVAA